MNKTLLFIFLFASFSALSQKEKYTNSLIHESSPYLLQHAHNPVNWYPWGKEALSKAKNENKMLIISIGYSACHWCHVMERECFEDTNVARIMNENFVCVKIDREERPDIDNIYMNSALLSSGSTGWPLNAFTLPNGQPFFAGTYYTKEEWSKLLLLFIEEFRTNKTRLSETADNITNGIHSINSIDLNEEEVAFSMDRISFAFDLLNDQLDMKKGGRLKPPKFPTPTVWKSILQFTHIEKNEISSKIVEATLNNMAYGGIYDHLQGGFSRYATDADWNIPHFEKMLYDNAQLVELYTLAWQKNKKPEYKDIVLETLDFITNNMTSSKGGFYSSFDADTEEGEGQFYVWTKQEIETALGENSNLFCQYFNITQLGNWEDGKNILYKNQDIESVKGGMSTEELKALIDRSKQKLLAFRNKRVPPAMDTKILTSWNALSLKAYLAAYRAFGDKRHLNIAKKNANYLLKNSVNESGEIIRTHKNNKASIPGFMDDYAFLISAFIDLYETTFDEKWLLQANKITEYAILHFQDTSSKMFNYNSLSENQTISSGVEIHDQEIPASNSEMAINLIRLGHYFENEQYLNDSKQMVLNVHDRILENPYFYSNWLRAEMFLIEEPYEVAITGKNVFSIKSELDQNHLPFVLYYGAKKKSSLSLLEGKFIKGETTIFVCKNRSCKLPVTTTREAIELMK